MSGRFGRRWIAFVGHLARKTVLVAVLATFAAATTAGALQYPDFKCRATINKKTVVLGVGAMKVINSCLYNEMSKSTGVNCNDLDNPYIAETLKIPGYETKLFDSVENYCHEVPASEALAEYQPGPCPSPAVDAVVDDFQDVAQCEADIVEGMVENVRRYILNPDTEAIADIHPDPYALIKCAKTIAYRGTRLWQTVTKTRGRCQYYEDKLLPPDGDVDACTTYDDGKIAASIATFDSYVDSACGPASGLGTNDLWLLHSCGADVATIKSCVVDAIVKNASGVNSTTYEFPGVCPTEVKLTLNSGTPTDGSIGRQSNTVLDVGWTGLGHRIDVLDGFVTRLDLNCSDNSCSSCAITASCEEHNCRCSNNPALECGHATGPFTQDVCGAANTCRPVFGPPLPLNAGGSPVCVTNTIATPLAGTADFGTGSSSTQVNDTAKIFLGIAQNKPCPTCSGATLGAAGSCSGGANNGAACVTNAIHPDFGGLSYQCQPTLASNISGSGLKLMLSFTDGAASLPFGDTCDAPNGSSSCACGVCSGDNSVPCNGDADCSGLGTCEKGSSGVARRPNSCGSLQCDDQGNGIGECDQSPPDRDLFCDGYQRKSGDGIITCATNADCTALNSECPFGSCGTCTLEQRKRCFLDPIEATGVAGSDGSEVVSTFCAPPTASVGVNAASGLPGPGRITLDWDFTTYCPDGTTEYELGGANCPP